MSTADAQREFAVAVVRRLQDAGFRAMWAGGCVRDLLMGRVPRDYDVATDGRPNAVRDLFGRRRTLAVGESFGVIVVIGTKESGNVEVATFRTEGPYLDGRRPENVAFGNPEEDARRRDFTINGMFYDPIAEKVHDYVGGEKDLGARIVRAIGNPLERMTEDKLRLLRAVRFAGTLEFSLDEATGEAVRLMAPQIHVVSIERVAQELKKMLVDPHRARSMELTRDVGLLFQILPELSPRVGADQPSIDDWTRTLGRLQNLNDASFELAAAALFRDLPEAASVAAAIGKRLKLSNQETETIVWLLNGLPHVLASRSKSLAELKRLLAHPSAPDVIELARVDIIARDGDLSPMFHCQTLLRQSRPEDLNPVPLITGDDLMALGLEPCKLFRALLEAARDAQLNGAIATRDEALELVQKLLRDLESD